jgi:glutamyl/glutaminyl-tRNA synthetase
MIFSYSLFISLFIGKKIINYLKSKQISDEIREQRGTLTEPGKESPYRNRSIEENLDLFARMRAGEFEDGYFHCLKIDDWDFGWRWVEAVFVHVVCLFLPAARVYD